jgi:hypothetical protein
VESHTALQGSGSTGRDAQRQTPRAPAGRQDSATSIPRFVAGRASMASYQRATFG